MKALMLLFCLFCLFPGLASAGTLYRCVGAASQVSYQAKPCAAGQRMDRTIEFTAVPDSPLMATASSRPRSTASGSRSRSRTQRAGSAKRAKPDACLQAQTNRTQRLDALGLKRTYADLSRLDEPVRAACRW